MRCIVCHKLTILRPFAAEFQPGLRVCSKRCWKIAASAVEMGLDFVYLPTVV